VRFLTDRQARLFSEEATREFAREVAADLRAATSTYPDDPEIGRLVRDLLDGSPEFAQIWARHEVGRQQSLCQTIFHPQVGRIDVICEVLVVPEPDQRVVLYTAGSTARRTEAPHLGRGAGPRGTTGRGWVPGGLATAR
jgi:hypothetical protein